MPIVFTVITSISNSADSLVDSLLSCLRDELAGYGDVLALFDEQQSHLMNHDAERVAQSSLALEDLMQTASRLRASRETCVADFARACKRPATTRLPDLLSFFDEDIRILFSTLIAEINHLIHRVRRRAQHNHTLLSSICRLHHERISRLRPDNLPGTYSATGRISAPASSTLQAAG